MESDCWESQTRKHKRMTTSVPNNVKKLRHLDISGEEGHVGGAEEEEKQKQNKTKMAQES